MFDQDMIDNIASLVDEHAKLCSKAATKPLIEKLESLRQCVEALKAVETFDADEFRSILDGAE